MKKNLPIKTAKLLAILAMSVMGTFLVPQTYAGFGSIGKAFKKATKEVHRTYPRVSREIRRTSRSVGQYPRKIVRWGDADHKETVRVNSNGTQRPFSYSVSNYYSLLVVTFHSAATIRVHTSHTYAPYGTLNVIANQELRLTPGQWIERYDPSSNDSDGWILLSSADHR